MIAICATGTTNEWCNIQALGANDPEGTDSFVVQCRTVYSCVVRGYGTLGAAFGVPILARSAKTEAD
jgi:hypothetical protein